MKTGLKLRMATVLERPTLTTTPLATPPGMHVFGLWESAGVSCTSCRITSGFKLLHTARSSNFCAEAQFTDSPSHLWVWNIWPSASPWPESPAALSACRPRPRTAVPRSASPGSPVPVPPGPPSSPRRPESSWAFLFLCRECPAGRPSAASGPAARRHSVWSALATKRFCPVLNKVD